MAPPITHTLATLSLPRSLVWVDEFQWTAPLRAQEYSITGALIVDVATRQAGRPITLQGVADHGWMTRAALADLWALANTPEAAPLALTLADGRAFAVRFADGNPIEAEPITRAELPQADLPYVVTLRLITA